MPSGVPVARISSSSPPPVRYGTLCPALAMVTWPDPGSMAAYWQVTNMLRGMSPTSGAVHPFEDAGRFHHLLSHFPQQAAGGRHHQGGRHPLAADVADHHAEPPVGELQEVVEVAPDLLRGRW